MQTSLKRLAAPTGIRTRDMAPEPLGCYQHVKGTSSPPTRGGIGAADQFLFNIRRQQGHRVSRKARDYHQKF